MRKPFSKSIAALAVILLLCSANDNSFAQKIAPGFHAAFTVPPDNRMTGGWDVIAGFDLDKDGKKEFIWLDDPTISDGTTSTDFLWGIHYWENDGDNKYVERWSWRPKDISNAIGRSWPAVALGDIDNDGFVELYFGSPATPVDNPGKAVPRLYVFEHDGTNFPAEPQETWALDRPAGFDYAITSINIADVDQDGDQELILTSRRDSFGGTLGSTGGRTMVIANAAGSQIGFGLADFEIEFADSSSVLKGGFEFNGYLTDFDGNGKQEIWIFTWDMVSWAVYEATAPNRYALLVDVNQATAPDDEGEHRGVQFIDMNKDGKLEMFISTSSGDGEPPTFVHYVPNTTDLKNMKTTDLKKILGPYIDGGGSASGDIDGDGKMDFLYIVNTGAGPNKVMRMEYKGSGSLADSTSYEKSVLYEDNVGKAFLLNIAIADVDGDNRTNILIASSDIADANDNAVTIIESDNVSTAVRETLLATPGSFSLSQNYPNPLLASSPNAATIIEFELTKPEHVVVTLYDMSGREISKLLDREMNAGKWRVPFDGKALPAGAYFYQLKAGDFSATKKMIVVQ